MATQTLTKGPLENWYRNRIGEPSTKDEVRGYWLFALGLILGVIGIGLFTIGGSDPNLRLGSFVIAAAGLLLLIAGPVIRLPLRQTATWLVYLGVFLGAVSIVWFVNAILTGTWDPVTGGSLIIGLYAVGLIVMGVAAVFGPILNDREELEAQMSGLQNEIAEFEETAKESEVDKAELEEVIADLRSTLSKAEADEADLQSEVKQLQSDLADTEADQTDLAAVLTELRESDSQFELYEDRGGEWRWRLRHMNGDIIGASNEGYDRQNDAQKSMHAVRRDAYGATALVFESEEDLPEAADIGSFVFAEEVESKAAFELYEGEGGDYRWRLRHDNDNIIATAGQGYASRSGAKHSIEEIREYAGPADYLQADPTAIEIYRDEAGEWRWRLLHRNGNILAGSGEGYASRSGVREVIDRLREQSTAMDIEVYEDEGGGFRWRLAGEDDKIIVDSGAYESRDGAKDAVERVREFLPEADIIDIGKAAFEVYEDEGGEHRWRLRHRNGNILATGAQGYSVRSGVWNGIESVKRNAPNADLEESEE